MRQFIEAIDRSLHTENWYAALVLALTMPDMCAVAEDPKKSSIGERYRDWCDRFLVKRFTSPTVHGQPPTIFLSADDLWKLRNAVIHEGSGQVRPEATAALLRRVGFSAGGAHMNLYRLKGHAFLNLTVPNFCQDVIAATEEWLSAVRDSVDVQERLASRLVVHEEDYSPIPGLRIGVRKR